MYAALLVGDTFLFYPVWDKTPHSKELGTNSWEDEILNIQYTTAIPKGSYSFYAVITDHNTINIIGLDSVTVKFE